MISDLSAYGLRFERIIFFDCFVQIVFINFLSLNISYQNIILPYSLFGYWRRKIIVITSSFSVALFIDIIGVSYLKLYLSSLRLHQSLHTDFPLKRNPNWFLYFILVKIVLFLKKIQARFPIFFRYPKNLMEVLL